jgi:hypothetical protein
MDNKHQILKVLVGSRAHGLATPESDYDYRGVFVVPTVEILKLGGHTEQTNWIEGKEDNTSWEIGHFLNMAVHCNPTILETFLAPLCEEHMVKNKLHKSDLGVQLRELFPYVWNSKDVMNAFIGYGHNQRKKFLDNKDQREAKYATAYLRVLYNAWELLSTGTFSSNMKETSIFKTLKRFKNKEYQIGEVIQTCFDWEEEVRKAYKENPDKKTNIEPVNEFLLKVRKEYWV